MKKKIMALLLAALLVVGILPTTAMAIKSYDYYKWDDSQKLVAANTEDKTVNVINASNKPTELNGWYYVDSELTVSDAVELTGETNIILGTDANITFNKGIIGSVQTLNIYGVNANGTGGELIANGSNGNSSGIGDAREGQPGIDVSYFNMHGGTVTVTGGEGVEESATNGQKGGIGIAIGAEFNMYGGTVTVTGGSGGNGTNNNGGGDGETGISMSEAQFNMYGGTVTATGGNGGSGCNYEGNKGGNGGVGISNIKMYGGTVNTTGGNGGSGDNGGNGGFGLRALSMTGGKIVVKGGQGGTGGEISRNGTDSAAIDKDDGGYYTPKLGDPAAAMNGINPIPKGFVITTDTNVDGSTKAKWAPNGTALNDASYKYVEITFGEGDDTPDEVRHSYTTITIGGNKDKAETKAEEVKEEENPDTGAPVMNLGAVAVVLGAAYVLSKKH